MNALQGAPRPEGAAYTRPEGQGVLAAGLLFLTVSLLLRVPGFIASVLDPDEGLYLLQATAWLGGGWPYLAIWDMHAPGAPALLMPAAATPWPVLGMRLTAVVTVALTALALRGVVLVLGGGALTGLAAGLLYIAHTVVLGGLATNTEVLLAPFVATGALLLLAEARATRAGVVPHIPPVFLAGLMFGVALWIKQVAAVEASTLFLVLAWAGWSAGVLGLLRLGVMAVAFAIGSGLPMLSTGFIYWSMGELEIFLHANLWAPFGYGDVEDPFTPGLRAGVAGALPHLALLGAAAVLPLLLPGQGRRAGVMLLPWLLAAAVAVAAPGKFYDHYFLLLLPPLSVMAALGLARIGRRVVLPEARGVVLIGAVAAIATVPVVSMLSPRLALGLGLRAPDPLEQVAALAREVGDTLFVANWHPVVYVMARRESPTPYAFPSHLSGVHATLTGRDQQQELERVLATRPAAIVVAPVRWNQVRPEARQAIEAALAASYELAGTVQDGRGPVEVWRLRR